VYIAKGRVAVFSEKCGSPLNMYTEGGQRGGGGGRERDAGALLVQKYKY
jgi:hypothetical protein